MTTAELDRIFGTASAYFSLMSDPTRLKILHAICGDEKSLREIAAAVPASQSTVLRHLAVMRRHGVVVRRKGSHEDLYAVADSTMIELCRTICRQMAERCAARATRSEDDIQRPAAPQ